MTPLQAWWEVRLVCVYVSYGKKHLNQYEAQLLKITGKRSENNIVAALREVKP